MSDQYKTETSVLVNDTSKKHTRNEIGFTGWLSVEKHV